MDPASWIRSDPTARSRSATFSRYCRDRLGGALVAIDAVQPAPCQPRRCSTLPRISSRSATAGASASSTSSARGASSVVHRGCSRHRNGAAAARRREAVRQRLERGDRARSASSPRGPRRAPRASATRTSSRSTTSASGERSRIFVTELVDGVSLQTLARALRREAAPAAARSRALHRVRGGRGAQRRAHRA